MTRLKILLSTFWGLPHTGGLSLYVYILKDHLEQCGHEVEIFAQHPSLTKYHLSGKELGIPKKNIANYVLTKLSPSYERSLEHIESWMLNKEIERYCFELAASKLNLHQFDMIHVQDVISALAFSRIKPKNVTLIATIHGWLTQEVLLTGMIQRNSISHIYCQCIEELGLFSNEAVIFPSQWLKRSLENKYGEHRSSEVIPYGLEANSFLSKSPEEKEGALSRDKHIISCVARLKEYKGHRDLIYSLEKLSKLRNDWVCWMIGDGPLRSELEQLVQKLNLGQSILFLGDRKDVPKLLAETDIFVLPSHIDNLPFAVIEAQLSGKPVVVSNAGGIPEIVNSPETGFIYSVGDVDQLCSYIQQLLQNRNLRERIGKQAKQSAKSKWTIQNMMLQTLQLYEKVCNSKQKENKDMEPANRNDRLRAPHSFFYEEDHRMNDSTIFDDEVCKKIFTALPEDYIIPDPRILDKVRPLHLKEDHLKGN